MEIQADSYTVVRGFSEIELNVRYMMRLDAVYLTMS